MLAMRREDFMDAPSGGAAADTTRAAAPPPGRPFHGGWALMVAAGLIAAVANYAVLTADEPTTALAVLATRAPAGTPVEALELTTVRVAMDDPRAHLLATPEDLAAMRGVVTTSALEPGTVLRSTDLRPPPGEGLGAMGVPVDPARAAGGLLQPGDRVDVIAGQPVDGTGPGGVRAVYVVRDVEVLGVLAPGTGVGSVGGTNSVTLALDGDQALEVAQALRDGEVDLVRSSTRGPGS